MSCTPTQTGINLTRLFAFVLWFSVLGAIQPAAAQSNVQIPEQAPEQAAAPLNDLGSQVPADSGAECGSLKTVTQEFDNGARWSMCLDSNERENIVLSNVFYTPPDAQPLRVFGSLRLSQLHVVYDDSNVTFHDVTQFGLGGAFRVILNEDDCPGGTLLNINGEAAACTLLNKAANTAITTQSAPRADSLSLFSISQVGSYAYTVRWQFYDNGALEPSISAAGALQRNTTDTRSLFGRVLEGVTDKSWLSHTHNYYWRLDFDLGDSGTDDAVYRIDWPLQPDGTRIKTRTRLTTETSDAVQPDEFRAWDIMDTGAPNSIGYRIEPLHYGHRLVQADKAPYTEFDFFVTTHNDCERFASQNTRFNPECDDSVLDYANGESLDNADLVAWHRISFHHLPRNEDRELMHSHHDSFLIQPRNISPGSGASAGPNNLAPVITLNHHQSATVGTAVNITSVAQDADQDTLTITADSLPDGLTLTERGGIAGTPTGTGQFTTVLTVSDNFASDELTIEWRVKGASKSGAIPPLTLPLLLLMLWRRGCLPARRSN